MADWAVGMKVRPTWGEALGKKLNWWRPSICGTIIGICYEYDGAIRAVIVEWVPGKVYEAEQPRDLLPA